MATRLLPASKAAVEGRRVRATMGFVTMSVVTRSPIVTGCGTHTLFPFAPNRLLEGMFCVLLHPPHRTKPLYRERLAPGVGTWLLVLVAGGASYLVGAPISIPVGVIAGAVVSAVLGWLLYASSPVIEVSAGWVRVGRARIEREYIGRVQAFRGDDARRAAGPELDGRAYMCFRPWGYP